MPNAMSDAYKNMTLNSMLRGAAFTVNSSAYAQLHSGDPGIAGNVNIISGPARQLLAFGSVASGGSIANTGQVDFPSMPATTVSWITLWTAASGGTFLFRGQLSEPVTTVLNDTFTLTAGDVTVSMT